VERQLERKNEIKGEYYLLSYRNHSQRNCCAVLERCRETFWRS